MPVERFVPACASHPGDRVVSRSLGSIDPSPTPPGAVVSDLPGDVESRSGGLEAETASTLMRRPRAVRPLPSKRRPVFGFPLGLTRDAASPRRASFSEVIVAHAVAADASSKETAIRFAGGLKIVLAATSSSRVVEPTSLRNRPAAASSFASRSSAFAEPSRPTDPAMRRRTTSFDEGFSKRTKMRHDEPTVVRSPQPFLHAGTEAKRQAALVDGVSVRVPVFGVADAPTIVPAPRPLAGGRASSSARTMRSAASSAVAAAVEAATAEALHAADAAAAQAREAFDAEAAAATLAAMAARGRSRSV